MKLIKNNKMNLLKRHKKAVMILPNTRKMSMKYKLRVNYKFNIKIDKLRGGCSKSRGLMTGKKQSSETKSKMPKNRRALKLWSIRKSGSICLQGEVSLKERLKNGIDSKNNKLIH